nr:hypothetical protein [Saccharopolyspora pogona]
MDAQLRRTVGVSDSPDSSKKKSTLRVRRRFFDPGPVFGDPGGDPVLVTLAGASGRALRAPAEPVPQDVSHMARVMPHSGDAFDHRGNPLQSPEILVESMRARTRQ